MTSIAQLFIYPIKSARGFSPGAWSVDRLGFAYDRRWVVALPDGRGLTQREEPRLAQLVPRLAADHLMLTAPALPPLEVPLSPSGTPELFPVRIHDTPLAGASVSAPADAWLTRLLGYDVRLIGVHEERRVDPRYAVGADDRTGFADAFPFLVVGRGSLDALNARLAQPVPVDRFRPNLVIAGAAPFAEDGWRRIRAGEVELAVVKPCARCVITTTDQQTGARGEEPLRTLAAFRRDANGKVMFGQNAIHLGTGMIGRGDVVSVLDPAPGAASRGTRYAGG